MVTSHAQTLKSSYPWTQSPLISSAPMRLISTPPLAIAVSRAGGLGFIGAGTDVSNLSSYLSEAFGSLESSPIPNSPTDDTLPIGVGFICWGADLATATKAISEAPKKPAAAWLFAPSSPQHLLDWSTSMRDASNGKTKIWIQVGTVAAALDAVKNCKADVLVVQGADAGGHGLAHSSSIIALLPEVADALVKEGYGHIPLIAAGGISDGRGTAAALMLGASGVCMGTRFLATPEAVVSAGYRKAVVAASDGGIATARTTVYDQIRGTHGWPETYNARGVLNESFRDSEKGMGIEDNARLYVKEVDKGDEGWGDKGRMTTYAGTGVGLVRGVMPAGGVVQQVLREAREKLCAYKSSL